MSMVCSCPEKTAAGLNTAWLCILKHRPGSALHCGRGALVFLSAGELWLLGALLVLAIIYIYIFTAELALILSF